MSKRVFIAWTRYQRRSELLAEQLGAAMHFIYILPQGKFLNTFRRYIAQGIKTWQVLKKERPGIIFIQNPPIFCVLVAYIYAKLHKARYVIDSHTGSFIDGRWRWSLGLHRIFSRDALTTIIHNNSLSGVVTGWGCNYLVLFDYPGVKSTDAKYPLEKQFNVAVVSSFSQDEPIEEVFNAARAIPEVGFYVTGNPRSLDPQLLAKKPENCHLTGYLPDDQYIGLIQCADATIALTTRNFTVLSGAFEAVSIGTPLIVSDWPVLKEYFSLGTVHVSNTAQGICEGVRHVQREKDVMKRDIVLLREQLQSEWKREFAKLSLLLETPETTFKTVDERI